MASKTKLLSISKKKTLSIIIPVFNEQDTIAELLKKVLSLKLKGWDSEIIIVDDGSTDKTAAVLSEFTIYNLQFTILKHKKNLGKGAAIQTGLKATTGDAIIVQDSDLEYDPKDIPKLLKELEKGKEEIVFGSRKEVFNKKNYFFYVWGINLSTNLLNVLYGTKLTDLYTCYKLYDAKALKSISAKAYGFEWDIEAVVKLLKKGFKIKEVPISYFPRKFSEGKKIKPWHGIIGLWVIIKYRIMY